MKMLDATPAPLMCAVHTFVRLADCEIHRPTPDPAERKEPQWSDASSGTSEPSSEAATARLPITHGKTGPTAGPAPDPAGLRAPRTEAGRRLLDAYFQPADEEQRLLGGGGIEHLVAAIEDEAALATPAPLDLERLYAAIVDELVVLWGEPSDAISIQVRPIVARSIAERYARLAATEETK